MHSPATGSTPEPPAACPDSVHVTVRRAAVRRRPEVDDDELYASGVPLAGPVPEGLYSVLKQEAVHDATRLERARDLVLHIFARPKVARLFLILAVIVALLVVAWGLVIAWAVLGLFLRVDNGWNNYSDECVALARQYNQTLAPDYIPKPPGAKWGWSRHTDVEFCTANQYWFNASIKAFVVLFSYINFLPIPWRLAILHDAWCSPRFKEPSIGENGLVTGFDFYGRPTNAMWFSLPRRRRRQISLLLNCAYAFHFASLAMHRVYYTYLEGQTWPGVFWQNLPFLLSIGSQIAAGVIQGKAETEVRKQEGGARPPTELSVFLAALRKWRVRGGDDKTPASSRGTTTKPSLISVWRTERRLAQAASSVWEKSASRVDPLTGIETVHVSRKPARVGEASLAHAQASVNVKSPPSCAPALHGNDRDDSSPSPPPPPPPPLHLRSSPLTAGSRASMVSDAGATPSPPNTSSSSSDSVRTPPSPTPISAAHPLSVPRTERAEMEQIGDDDRVNLRVVTSVPSAALPLALWREDSSC